MKRILVPLDLITTPQKRLVAVEVVNRLDHRHLITMRLYKSML
jgi:hypothetical protein